MTTIIFTLAIIGGIVWKAGKNYAKKNCVTSCLLLVCTALSIFQAIFQTNLRLSIAWYLLAAIWLVLVISNVVGLREYQKAELAAEEMVESEEPDEPEEGTTEDAEQ